MNRNINYFLFFVFIFSFLWSSAQSNKIDSLEKALLISKEDTNKVTTLNALAWEISGNDATKALEYSQQALSIAEQLPSTKEKWTEQKQKFIANSYHQIAWANYLLGNYPLSLEYNFKAVKIRESLHDKLGVSRTLGNIGNVYYSQGEYSFSLNYYFKALKIEEELSDKKGIARHLGNIGVVYNFQGAYPKALDYFFKALKMNEEFGDKKVIAAALCNIGSVYYNQNNYAQALDYDFKALKMEEGLGNKTGIARNLSNIGLIYQAELDYPKALDYYFKSLKIDEELKNKSGIARHFGNIGGVYNNQARVAKLRNDIIGSDSLYKKTLDYDFMSLKLAEELGDKNGMARCLGSIGVLYTDLKKYKEAEKYLQRGLSLSTEINDLDLIKTQEGYFRDLYEQTNQPAKALEHYKKYIIATDSLFNEENTKKTVRSEMNFEFEKKEAVEKAEQEKQNAIAQQEKQKQKIILILISFFLLLVAVFASFMFNRWRITQKQKLIIEKQKEKIVDSITYAQLIQQSILMEESEIQKFLPECFIYFQPKDIVSGDFYWFSKLEDKIILAAIDCTGHGVPGAFMSMIGNTLLNQIVNEKQITTPSEILEQLNLGVTEALHQKKEGALSHDGMDIALCCIDFTTNQLQYAGAQNPLYIVADNNVTVINADRQSIGGESLIAKKKKSSVLTYTNHIIPIKEGMRIFLFTDGYMDQFGSNDRKKFGIQKFKKLVLDNQHLSMQQQKELIAKAHQDWKGSTAQIDDILVMGLKL